MGKIEEYGQYLEALSDWDDYLLHHSGLPGPRANLELMWAVARPGHKELFDRYLSYDQKMTPENTPELFLAICAVVGYGRLIAEGHMIYCQYSAV